jgi:hypothetical protein
LISSVLESEIGDAGRRDGESVDADSIVHRVTDQCTRSVVDVLTSNFGTWGSVYQIPVVKEVVGHFYPPIKD